MDLKKKMVALIKFAEWMMIQFEKIIQENTY